MFTFISADNLETAINAAVDSALTAEARRILRASRPRVPIERGWLRESAYYSDVIAGADGTRTITIGYGGPAGAVVSGHDVDYARYVHENLSSLHGRGGAKFLESVVTERTDTTPRSVGRDIARSLRSQLGATAPRKRR